VSDQVTYWLIANRGLEAVARDELLERIPDAANVEVAYRRVRFATALDPARLLALRLADDVFIDIATWDKIERARVSLTRMTDRAHLLDLRDAAELCSRVRDLGTPPAFAVTANFVGRRNYSTDEIKTAVAMGIEGGHGWTYMERDEDADLNLRVFIEHEQAWLGVRLAAKPLHERPYKEANIAGSLKPTVAAAMVRLGAFAPGMTIVDPLCGAGTIPLEAALVGLRARGGDEDPAALLAAERNRERAGLDVIFERWDARTLPLPDDSIDGVVCNLPWDRQVVVDDQLEHFYRQCIREIRRVVRPGGRVVLLTNLRPLLHAAVIAAELTCEQEIEISLSGQTPTISVWR
jgi:tRNA (guanine6-N2)-methyltransferase